LGKGTGLLCPYWEKGMNIDNNSDMDMDMDIIAETENFAVWRSEEGDGFVYHVELGGITLHLESEEWEELAILIKSAD
jgi:hypothetical protein